MTRTTGTVRRFSNPKGYGFLTDETGREIFVHDTSIEGAGFRSLGEDETVEFGVADTDRGRHTEDVRRTDRQAPDG